MSTNLTYLFGNNFENEKSAAAVTVPALITPEAERGTVAAKFVTAAEEYIALAIPANVIIKNFYLVVEEAMAGTVTVTLEDDTPVDIFAAATSVATVGATVSALKDVYVTEPLNVKFVFTDTQTAGQVKLAFDFLQLDTNTSKYLNA